MPTPEVCAVVHADQPGRAVDEVRAAVGAQSLPPREVLVVAGLAAAVRAVRASGARWGWLLDGRAVPRPDAIEALLAAHAAAGPPSPLLLASKVIDAGGRLHPGAAPRHEIFEKQHSVDAAERHLVQLRAAAPGSVLVDREALERFGPPRADLPAGLDLHEWSARILRDWDDVGYLVPASVALREDQPAPPPGCWRARLRVIRSPAWRPREKAWEAFLLSRELAARLGGRAAAQGREGVGAPGLTPSRTPRSTVASAEGARRLTRR